MRETIYLVLAVLPPLGIAALLLFGVFEQRAAQRYVDATVASLAASGKPTSNSMITEEHNEQTSIEGARDWNDLSQATAMLEDKYREAFRAFDDHEQLIPADAEWAAKPIAELYHVEAVPLIERMRTLVQRDKPLPGIKTYRNGHVSYYSGNWQGDDLLLREFRLAYHNDDSERAADVLLLYIKSGRVAWGGVLSDPLYYIIHRSLEHEFWTAETLQRVRQSLSSRERRRHSWPDQVAARRAALLTEVRVSDLHGGHDQYFAGTAPCGVAPTHVARYLRFYDELERLHGEGTRELDWDVDEAIDKMNAARGEIAIESMTAIPFSTCATVAGQQYGNNGSSHAAMSRMNDRRLLTAFAIKQFQLQEGRWPESLAELVRVGMSASDWKMIGNVDFGYRVDADGKTARLWRLSTTRDPDGRNMLNKKFQMPRESPSETVLSDHHIKAAETVIR